MDLLRNLGSAAASSLLQKSGISLPYSLGEKVAEYDGKSIWTLYDAIKKVCNFSPDFHVTPDHKQRYTNMITVTYVLSYYTSMANVGSELCNHEHIHDHVTFTGRL